MLQQDFDLYSLVMAGWLFKTHVCSATAGLLSSYEGHLRKLLEAWQSNPDSTRCEVGDPDSLPTCHSDFGIPIIFNKSQALSAFKALNSECLLRGQKYVRPPGEMSWAPRTFSRISTEDSDIPSSGEMKD